MRARAMKRGRVDTRMPKWVSGFRLAAAAVVAGFVLIASHGGYSPMREPPALAVAPGSEATPAVAKFEYFPDGYTLQATQPEEPVPTF